MSTILLYTSPARGHLYPMMDVALALRDRGHRVVVQTLAVEADRLAALGLEHRLVHAGIEALPLTDYQGGNPISQMRLTMGQWLKRASLEVTDLAEAMADLRPDLIVVDANTWGAAAFAQAQGRPWAMFLPYCLPVPSRDAPAFGPGFPPPKGPWSRLRDRLLWAVFRLATRPIVRELNALRQRVGTTPLTGLDQVYQQADILLYRTAEPFEYPRSDWPDNVRAIGPGLWAPPGEVPAWLHDLPRPRILVSVSTELQEDGAIIDTALESLADRPGSVVVTTAALDPDRFAAPHDRVRVTRFLPHADVLPHIDLVVTHGGMGMTQRALAAGVPLCVVPWGRDQSESAARVVHCGAGVRLDRSRLSPARLRAAVEEALTRREGAQRVADALERTGGAAEAVALLEGLLEGSDAATQVA